MLKVLNMMGIMSDVGDDGVEKVGEFAMEALEAVQYNTHPIDQVCLAPCFLEELHGNLLYQSRVRPSVDNQG